MLESRNMAKNTKKILVAEDEKPMAEAMELKLKKAGFNVKTAANGEEVLYLLGKEKFDLLLLDLIMPIINGFGVLTEIKTRNLDVPVIVLSNLGQESDVQKAKSLGALDYYVKSNTPLTEIVQRVKTFLRI